MNLAILAGSNIGYSTLNQIVNYYTVKIVFTDARSTQIINLAKQEGILLHIGNPRNGRASSLIESVKIDVLISVNYLFIIERDMIDWPKTLAFNVHGSLLPKYRGRTPHVWSIINGEESCGITAHIIDEKCDAGDILEQVEIPIGHDDTGASILKKYESRYFPIIKSVLSKVERNSIVMLKQNNSLATYFSKRSEKDGRINWTWHRQRIRNWIRAQSSPYPGAFTYYFERKIIIDFAEFSDLGYSDHIIDGTIIGISKGKPIIKTPNGALILTKIRGEVIFEIGKSLT